MHHLAIGGVITVSGRLTAALADRLRRDWALGVPLVGDGVLFHPLVVPPQRCAYCARLRHHESTRCEGCGAAL